MTIRMKRTADVEFAILGASEENNVRVSGVPFSVAADEYYNVDYAAEAAVLAYIAANEPELRRLTLVPIAICHAPR